MKRLTPIKELSTALILLTICTIALFIFRHFILGAIGIIIFIFLFRIWYRFLSEELVLNYVQFNGGQIDYKKLIEKLSERGRSAITRLEDKGIVEVKDDVVKLVDQNYISIFKKCRKCRIK